MSASEAPEDTAPPPTKILLDNPTATPALGFPEMGNAFATIIRESDPRFAVGIFGGWGSGKTTLMRTIMAALPKDNIVCVEFVAWRFEREPQLLIPLLDTIRAALVQWADDHPSLQESVPEEKRIRTIAFKVGRVVQALATALSVNVGLPGAVSVGYDFGTASDALKALAEKPPADLPASPQSLYVAAFKELEGAFANLSDGGVSRVVVFVDDLDRCLPGNALEVLESMKLFFDLPGFVFVVGLDEDVIERAVRVKLADQDKAAAEDRQAAVAAAAGRRLGREYIKKIFQVPYSLPAMLPKHLDGLLESLYGEAKLDSNQLNDLKKRVRPYLGYMADERQVNPREVKRFINAYILQTLIRPDLDADTVLALQTLAFRSEWQPFYDAILADSELFVSALRNYRDDDDDAFKALLPTPATMPPSLVGYLRSRRGEPLVRYESLDDYLSSVQSTSSTGSWTVEAFRQIENLRRAIENALGQELTNESARIVAEMADETTKTVSYLLSSAVGPEESANFALTLQQFQVTASRLEVSLDSHPDAVGDMDRELLVKLHTLVNSALAELRQLRETSVLRPLWRHDSAVYLSSSRRDLKMSTGSGNPLECRREPGQRAGELDERVDVGDGRHRM